MGIGPGEPDLITVRAKRFLTSADRVVCFDWLTNEVAHQIGGPEKIEVVTFESLGGPDSRARAKFCAQVRRWVSAGEKVVFATSAIQRFVRRLVGCRIGLLIGIRLSCRA